MRLFEYKDADVSFSYSINKGISDTSARIHMHDDYELYCFVSGDAYYMVEGREYPLEYGTVLLMRPGELHKLILRSDAPYERYVLNFSPRALSEDLRTTLLMPFKDRPLGEKNCYRPADFSGISPLDLISSMCCSEPHSSVRVKTMLPAVLSLIEAAFSGDVEKKENLSLGAEMVDWINLHLYDPVTVSMVVEQFHMSVSQVTRVFRAATGTTVGQYCRVKRLLRARHLISKGYGSQEACRACGFACYSSFFRQYKNQFGISPSEDKN